MEIQKFKQMLTEKELIEFNEDWEKYQKARTRLLQKRNSNKQIMLNKQNLKKE